MTDERISELQELTNADGLADLLVIVDSSTNETKRIFPSNLLLSLIDDQAASGYFSIGTLLVQWGEHTTVSALGDTITLPADFANTSYSLVGSVPDASNRFVAFQSKTTTDFLGQRISVNPNAGETGLINWIAIGIKG